MGKAIALESALKTTGFLGDDKPVHLDYGMVEGANAKSTRGKYLRHPFTDVHVTSVEGVSSGWRKSEKV